MKAKGSKKKRYICVAPNKRQQPAQQAHLLLTYSLLHLFFWRFHT
jgi:hypothetical protein